MRARHPSTCDLVLCTMCDVVREAARAGNSFKIAHFNEATRNE